MCAMRASMESVADEGAACLDFVAGRLWGARAVRHAWVACSRVARRRSGAGMLFRHLFDGGLFFLRQSIQKAHLHDQRSGRPRTRAVGTWVQMRHSQPSAYFSLYPAARHGQPPRTQTLPRKQSSSFVPRRACCCDPQCQPFLQKSVWENSSLPAWVGSPVPPVRPRHDRTVDAHDSRHTRHRQPSHSRTRRKRAPRAKAARLTRVA